MKWKVIKTISKQAFHSHETTNGSRHSDLDSTVSCPATGTVP